MSTKQFIAQKFVILAGVKPDNARNDLITIESSVGTLVLVNVYKVTESSILEFTAPHLDIHSWEYEPVTLKNLPSVTHEQLKDQK